MKKTPHCQSRCRPGHRLPRCWVGALIPALLVAGCTSGTEPSATLWEATLAPVPPANVTGSAAAVAQFGRTLASVEIRLAEPGVTYGWRVEAGTCQAPGQIQGGSAIYPPLIADQTGVAPADAVVPGVLKSGSLYVVRVLREPGGPGEQAVACGELVETG